VLPADDQVAGGADTLLAATGGSAAGLSGVDFAYKPEGGSMWISLGRAVPATAGGPLLGANLDQAVWAGSWKTSTLAPGPYTVRVMAFGRNGLTAESLRTLIVGASQPRGPPSVGFDLLATAAAGAVKLTWDATGTSFGIERSVDGASGHFVSIGSTTSHSFVDTRVVAGIEYAYRVTASGARPQFSPAVTAAAMPIPATGTRSADDVVNVSLPASVANRVSLAIVPASSMPALAPGMRVVGGAYDIDATSLGSGAAVHLLDQAATLTFALPADLTAAEAAGLAVYHWDPVTRAWRAEASTIDLANHTITAAVSHFSTFTVATTCGADVAGAPTLCVTPG